MERISPDDEYGIRRVIKRLGVIARCSLPGCSWEGAKHSDPIFLAQRKHKEQLSVACFPPSPLSVLGFSPAAPCCGIQASPCATTALAKGFLSFMESCAFPSF